MPGKDTAARSIKAARVMADMTQEEAAERIGVSRKTLSDWENGTVLSMSMASAINMARAYNAASIDQLVGFSARDQGGD